MNVEVLLKTFGPMGAFAAVLYVLGKVGLAMLQRHLDQMSSAVTKLDATIDRMNATLVGRDLTVSEQHKAVLLAVATMKSEILLAISSARAEMIVAFEASLKDTRHDLRNAIMTAQASIIFECTGHQQKERERGDSTKPPER